MGQMPDLATQKKIEEMVQRIVERFHPEIILFGSHARGTAGPDSDEVLRKIRQWVEKAEHDFTTAEYLLTLLEGCPFDTVCFHAQQCAEKYLKGFLTFRSVDFPKTHDLVVLLNLAGGPKALGIELLDVDGKNSHQGRLPALVKK